MILFNAVHSIQDYLSHHKRQRIGFVPTMGALHKGHLSLIQEAKELCELVVCSIYVNPTQFNEKTDLDHYPRPIADDIKKLEEVGCDILFCPSDQEVYPDDYNFDLTLSLDSFMKPMEGQHRPGHFEGMVQVVYRLLDIVKPDYLFMGEKDYQQYLIVSEMVKQIDMQVKVVACPIIREPDGLAMSSRNLRLTPEVREQADIIRRTLVTLAQRALDGQNLRTLTDWAMQELNHSPFSSEYVQIVNAQTLEPVTTMKEAEEIIACVAIWAGDIRLIDNIFLKRNT